jgi:hypothetical protein
MDINEYYIEKIWKEVVVAYFKIMSQHLPGRTGKNHENLSHDNQSLR